MKIFINTTNLKQGGSLQVSASVIHELVKFSGHEYHIFLSPQFAALVDTGSYPVNFHFYNIPSNPISSFKNLLAFRKKMSAFERGLKPDFVLTMFGPALWKPNAPHLVGFANGLYLYDKSKFIQDIWLNTPLKRLYFYLRRSILLFELKREASLIWTETQHAKNEINKALNFPGGKIFVVSNTYGIAYNNAPNRGNAKEMNGPFTFLYLTADYPHKNLDIFNHLLPLLKERNINCRFRLTLPAEVFQKRFPAYQNDPMLVNIGPISPSDGPKAYHEADALFFPSLIETFSANYPEAMISGRPIITSDLDFAHDICMDAALYFNPFEPGSIAETIETLINDAALRQKLVENGKRRVLEFDTATKRAEKLLNIMKDYLVSNR